MARAFDNAVKGLHRAARASRGLAVMYSRGDDSAAITAVPARSRVSMTDESGLTVTGQERDFIILAADLVLDGEQVLPERGDRIEQTVDGETTYTYEVMPIAGQKHYQPCDDQGRLLRIHTKLVESGEA